MKELEDIARQIKSVERNLAYLSERIRRGSSSTPLASEEDPRYNKESRTLDVLYRRYFRLLKQKDVNSELENLIRS